MSDIADENHRMVVSSINRYLSMQPLAMLVPSLDQDMRDWLTKNRCEPKATIFLGTFVMFPDFATQVAFKLRFSVRTRMIE